MPESPLVVRHDRILLGLFLVYLCVVLGSIALHMHILDGLNAHRSADDQIPIFNERLRDFEWWMDHFGQTRAVQVLQGLDSGVSA